MKNIVLKVNSQQESDFCGQILNKIGIKFINSLNFGEGREYLDIEGNKIYFFTYKNIVEQGIEKENTILVNSWREFILNYLSNFYYLCETKEEKEKLINIICENGLNEKSNFIYPIDMGAPYFEKWLDNMCFNDWKPENKKEISLDNLLTLLHSVRQFKELFHQNNKNMKTEESFSKTKSKTINNTVIHLKNKNERAAAKAYLEGFFEENGLGVRFCKEAFNLNNDYIYFGLNYGGDVIVSWINEYKSEDFTNVLRFADLEEFANLIKDETNNKKVFKFKNGLVANYNPNNCCITISCKEKHIKFWRDFVNNLIKLNENFSISSYSFTVDEMRAFQSWLKNL